MTPVTIVSAGDLAPTPSNCSFFSSGIIESIVDAQLLEILSSADFRLFNLEVPLTDTEKPFPKMDQY
jgi:poly-gamma-glutamate synthesis protein (capsule biosynthesis protein)